MNAHTSPLALEMEAALQWWQLAGVDCDFAEDATDWLADVAEQAAAEAPPQQVERKAQPAPEPVQEKPQRTDLLGPTPPTDLETFRQFWLETPGLDAIGPRGRVAPRGPKGAELMVMVIDPEQGDGERLLDGPQGRLVTRMLAAMGLKEEETYIASALPRHTPMADTVALAAGGLDSVVLHHIKLAAPKRVIAFGANIPPLLGIGLTKDILSLREINQNSPSTPLLVSEGLDSLMSMPRLKARFWRRWMEWSADI